ncbi:septum formation inhibitor-activating ATPase, partial [Agromyces binzhouensis]
MARLALALDPSVEDRILADLVEAGHTIVARVVGRRDVLDCLDVLAPDVVVVGAGAATLDAELLAACDERGIRLIALASTDRDRAEADRIGLHEVLDADAEPAELEALLAGGPPVPSRLGD